MEIDTQKSFVLLHRVKDKSFDILELHDYVLSLQIGVKDFQFCVTNASKKVILFESYSFESVKTVNTRVQAIADIFKNNEVLSAGFWKEVVVSFKTHKFTLVPENIHAENTDLDFLEVSNVINPVIETVHHCAHKSLGLVNVFTGDLRLMKLIKSFYQSIELKVLHQGSTFIEGITTVNPASREREMLVNVDRGIFHIVIFKNKSLHYYNQFAIKKNEDGLRYIMLLFQELGLKQNETNITFWGNIDANSKFITLLRKYVRNISFGKRPSALTFSYDFDEIPEHQFFDLFNIPLS